MNKISLYKVTLRISQSPKCWNFYWLCTYLHTFAVNYDRSVELPPVTSGTLMRFYSQLMNAELSKKKKKKSIDSWPHFSDSSGTDPPGVSDFWMHFTSVLEKNLITAGRLMHVLCILKRIFFVSLCSMFHYQTLFLLVQRYNYCLHLSDYKSRRLSVYLPYLSGSVLLQ